MVESNQLSKLWAWHISAPACSDYFLTYLPSSGITRVCQYHQKVCENFPTNKIYRQHFFQQRFNKLKHFLFRNHQIILYAICNDYSYVEDRYQDNILLLKKAFCEKQNSFQESFNKANDWLMNQSNYSHQRQQCSSFWHSFFGLVQDIKKFPMVAYPYLKSDNWD